MTPLWMVSRLFQPLLLLVFKFTMLCDVDNYDSTKLVVFGLLQIWECALNWFTVEPLHECFFDICPHPWFRGNIS